MLLTASVFVLSAPATPARAQSVVMFVNGEPITTYDIDQLSRFLQLTTRKQPARQEVVDTLIDDKLKVLDAKRYKFEVDEKDIELTYEDMAKRMGLSGEQLTKALASAGVNASTLKARIKADITWQQLIRGKFPQSLQVREKDILEAVDTRKPAENTTVGYEYTLYPILFVVPRNAASGTAAQRTREAEALRSRFQNCDDGLPFARAIRVVAVRPPIHRNSGDLPAPLRELLDKTPVGQLTAPEVTAQGVELFAVCAKKETSAAAPARRQVREEMFAEQFQAKAKQHLRELRRSAMIEHVK
ncbi:MAG: peptidylprolyl isomerase [Proteobacteria bacterium]|nr:peptidylprolyl isomerase [Pseudomonadota bacterium]